jgi:hypothetical protein
MLAYSIEILQTIVELNDQAIVKKENEQTVALAIETSLNSADNAGEPDETVDDDQEQRGEEYTARMTVASPEEVARRKATNFKAFEG